jgi:hypothetical protein
MRNRASEERHVDVLGHAPGHGSPLGTRIFRNDDYNSMFSHRHFHREPIAYVQCDKDRFSHPARHHQRRASHPRWAGRFRRADCGLQTFALSPWLGVLAFEGINELMDIFHWHQGAFSFEIGDAFKDLFSTMLWPTVAVLALRFRETGVRKPKELRAVSSRDTPVK